MDQLGNTEPTTEEQDHDDQQPPGPAGNEDASRTPCTLAVYRAVPAVSGDGTGSDDDGTQVDTDASTDTNRDSGSTESAATPAATLFDAPIPVPGPAPDSASGSATAEPAEPATGATGVDGFPDGFTGVLAMANLESFDEHATGEVLARLSHLVR
ncbi:hypothetical protein N2K95_03705 [Arthrobacter zhaoxinii]|uniref:Uncharacterized protein n=1 Tax=Arthrobacter zhaoxinii TaxID=2964616 RepID=A0ABY5YU89_9MICC|nr:hypothetical protein [Arthrobacter zhaoxinii]UWX97801.1 hypothetical protein N2K95_03705 [Arthrobacter zhaoxinii]